MSDVQDTERAAAAEAAVTGRHLGRLWHVPTTALGRTRWPPAAADRLHCRWNYWWQAHLLDCLVDAQRREPAAPRIAVIARLLRGIRLRNRASWTNNYYDDMAWLGLALQRVGVVAGIDTGRAVGDIVEQLHVAWTRDAGGGIWWRRGGQQYGYKNAPANGPAAILHARTGDVAHAHVLTAWLSEHLVDPATGLVWDGLRVDRTTGEVTQVVKRIYTYCQGVYLGACLELHEHSDTDVWSRRCRRTIEAVAEVLAPSGVLRGHGGGDGGLFSGILARYLALAARTVPDSSAAATAAELVTTSARACWSNAADGPHGPVFGADWAKPAALPDRTSTAPTRDLSVQVGGWMLLEAAATL